MVIMEIEKIQLVNIVAVCQLRGEIPFDLAEIAEALGENAEYVPSQFPALVYRLDSPHCSFLLFRSGKVVCSGCRNIRDVHKAVEQFKRKLEGVQV